MVKLCIIIYMFFNSLRFYGFEMLSLLKICAETMPIFYKICAKYMQDISRNR